MSANLVDKPMPFVPWGPQAAPVDPAETLLCMRAQSILSGPDLGQCPPLTVEQARDVLAWHNNVHVLPVSEQRFCDPTGDHH